MLVGTPYKKHRTFEGYDAIVIGSGISGLTAAALLTKFGDKRDLVLERHYTAGGFTQSFTRPGYEWDAGGHHIGQVLRPGSLASRLFHTVTNEEIRWATLGEVYDRVFPGDMTFDLVAGAERLLDAFYQAMPQARGRVEIAELSTPLSTVEFTGHPQGAIYGLAHTPARFRDPLLHPQTPIGNLYLTGADVSTAGVMGAMVGGALTANVILRRNLLKAS